MVYVKERCFMLETAFEFVAKNWIAFVGGGFGIWAVTWYIYSIAGKNKPWHKY
jgi:type IV secretory pathway TrbD component